MASVKQKKLLGFVFTLVAALVFTGLAVLVIALTLGSGFSLKIETVTLLALQFVAFVLLLIGMLLRKENLILGTLVAALASSAVSYMVSDVDSILSAAINFSDPWYIVAVSITGIVVDAFLTLATITFLIYLLNGHRPTTRSVASLFFACYFGISLIQIVFLSIAATQTDEATLALLGFLADLLTMLAFVIDIDAYFFRKDNDSLILRLQESKEQLQQEKTASKKALSSLENTIAEYQSSILPSAFKEENGHLELTIDLKDIPLYEDCSGKTLLNNAIYSFVEDVAFSLAAGHELSIRFLFPDGISAEEKKKVIAIFRAHYAIHYKNLRDKVTREMILAITFVFAGFLLITFHLPYVKADDQSVYGEMLDIFGWVFTWEAVEILCVNSLDNQGELHQYQLLYAAKIIEEPVPSEIRSK